MTVLKIYPTATVVVCGDSKSLMHQRLLVRAGSVNNRTGSTQWLRATLKLGEPVNFCELRHNPFEAQAAPPLVLSRYKWSISHTLGNPEILRKQRPILVQSLLTKHFPPSKLTGFFCLKKAEYVRVVQFWHCGEIMLTVQVCTLKWSWMYFGSFFVGMISALDLWIQPSMRLQDGSAFFSLTFPR